jgi:hypothetical protein
VCGALKLLKRSARFSGCLVAQRCVRSNVVVIVSPKGKFALGIVYRLEDFPVQQLVSQAAIEAFDESFCCCFS